MSKRAKTLMALGALLGVKLIDKPRSKRTMRPYADRCPDCENNSWQPSIGGDAVVCGQCSCTFIRGKNGWRKVER